MPGESRSPIRVLLADDHFVVRQGLCSVLKFAMNVAVIAEAQDGDEAVALFRQHRPDVTLMDVRMPKLDGIAATRRIMAEFPAARVLVLSTDDAEPTVRQSLDAGARGYLLKAADAAELTAAIHAVHDGATWLPNSLRQVLKAAPPPIHLSLRQREVLELLARGFSNKQIAAALGFTTDGTKAHLKTIYARLDVQDRTEAVVAALRLGLVSIPR